MQLKLFETHDPMSKRERNKAIHILKDIAENLKGLEDEFAELKEDRRYFEIILKRIGEKNERD